MAELKQQMLIFKPKIAVTVNMATRTKVEFCTILPQAKICKLSVKKSFQNGWIQSIHSLLPTQKSKQCTNQMLEIKSLFVSAAVTNIMTKTIDHCCSACVQTHQCLTRNQSTTSYPECDIPEFFQTMHVI